MPKEIEEKLKREVADKSWSKERKNAYIYGTLRKTGWKPHKKGALKKIMRKSKV